MLDVDDTQKPQAQGFFTRFFIKTQVCFFEWFWREFDDLKRKHLVDAFLVTNMDGTVIVSSEGNGINED